MEVTPRETALESGGHVKGVAVAIVRDNKDDSGQARVKVSYPWHSKPQHSYWARVAMPMAGKDRGVYFLPEVEDEVLVAFERGDLRFPYVVGSLHNGKDPAPVKNADGKNDVRVIHTRKNHKLTFDDGDKGLAQLELNDGKKLTLKDDEVRLTDENGNSFAIQSASGAVTIDAKGSVTIKAPSITLQSSGTLEIKAGATLTLRGALVNIN
jgi:uncharacterized protein involved in type VI secretion and phage assembly